MTDPSNILSLALEHHQAGRLDEAESLYLKLIDGNPDQADAYHLLGMIAHARGDHATAIDRIAAAILIAPSTVEFHANIVAVYLAVGRSAEAVAHGRRAVAIDPEFFEGHYNLGNALFAQGEVVESIECFDAARKLSPDNIFGHTNYLFAINFTAAFDRARIYEENLAWGDAVMATLPDAKPQLPNTPEPNRRLRIGYYLPEPGSHVTPRFLETLLRYHDHDLYDVYVYEFVGQGGPAPERLRAVAPNWRDLTGLSPASEAEAIRADQIDILNHTATYKARYRMVLAHHAAPLQIASTNIMATTGLRTVDYIVSDEDVDPAGRSEAYYCENLIRLSRFNAYQPPADSPPVSPLPAASNGFLTFGSFNNIAKVSAESLNAWAAILRRLPSARLVLKHRALDDPAVVARIASEFDHRGLNPERFEFQGFTADRAEYLAAYGGIDIALDPFPFGGGTTSFEALWMGVPVVTLGGDGFMAAQGAGAMRHAGFEQFIAGTPETYLETAVAAADDLPKLASVREHLRDRLAKTAFNGAAHVAELEAAYRRIWRDYCATPDHG